MALKILLADDSMTAQNMGKKILADAGYDVLAVSNGAAAIKKIASDRPDIIILDVYMPGYTGLEVCERVKGATETARIPVLLTVGKMEPFKPEDANRVRADGVMIKPFEATDLIAVIQSIANKMAGGAAPEPPDSPHPPVVAVVDRTVRIPPPSPAQHQDTIQIPPPSHAESHATYEETIRLTPEQVRQFQDKTYKEWVASAEENEEAPQVTESVQAESDSTESVVPSTASILEPIQPAVFEETRESETPIMPGLDPTEAHIARAMAGAMAGHNFFTVTPSPASSEPTITQDSSPAFFTPAEELASAQAEAVFKIQHTEAEFADTAEMPAIVESATPELETSAPLAPESVFTSQLEDLEENVAPVVEIVAETVPELEINSPIHAQPDFVVSADPALVSNDGDMSQFVTQFGVEGAEDIPVGVMSDLPAEQLAALTSPQPEAEIVQEVPVLETPEVSYPPMVAAEPEPPAAEEVSVVVPEPPAIVSAIETVERPTSVLDEIGTIEPEAPLTSAGPMVAYVPAMEDTQPVPAYVETEVTPPVFAPEPEAVAVAAEPAPVAEPEPVAAVTIPEDLSGPAESEPAMPAIESAAAAVVGAAGVAGAMQFFTSTEPAYTEEPEAVGFAPATEQVPSETAMEMPVEAIVSEAAPDPIHEPMGDAELAARAAAEAAIATTVEPVVAAAAEPAAAEHANMSDSRLSDAVSHALEKLRPQLIAEIIRELMK